MGSDTDSAKSSKGRSAAFGTRAVFLLNFKPLETAGKRLAAKTTRVALGALRRRLRTGATGSVWGAGRGRLGGNRR